MKFTDKTFRVIKLVLHYWFSILIRDDSCKRRLYLQEVLDAITSEDGFMLWEVRSYSIKFSKLDSGKTQLLIKGYTKGFRMSIEILRRAMESAKTRNEELFRDIEVETDESSISFIFPGDELLGQKRA